MADFVVYVLDLVEDHKGSAPLNLDELAEVLASEPTSVSVEFTDVPEMLQPGFDAALDHEEFARCAIAMWQLLRSQELDEEHNRFFVRCSSEHPLAKKGVKGSENESAKYGAAARYLAAAYKPDNRLAAWHEVLHLLGADDCYESYPPYAPKPSCSKKYRCIMQYRPGETGPLPWPFLCDHNTDLIRKAATQS